MVLLLILHTNLTSMELELTSDEDYGMYIFLKKNNDFDLTSSQLMLASDFQDTSSRATGEFFQKVYDFVWSAASTVVTGAVKPLALVDKPLSLQLQNTIYCHVAYPFIKNGNKTVIRNFDADVFKSCISQYRNDWLQFLLQSGVDANKAGAEKWKDWKKVLAVTSTSYNHEAFSLLCAYGLEKEHIFKVAIMSIRYNQSSLLESCFNNGVDVNALCLASLKEQDSSNDSPFAVTETIVRKCLSDQRLIDTVLKQKLSKDTKYHFLIEAFHTESLESIKKILAKSHRKFLIKKILRHYFMPYLHSSSSTIVTDEDYINNWNELIKEYSGLKTFDCNGDKALLWKQLILKKNSYNFVE